MKRFFGGRLVAWLAVAALAALPPAQAAAQTATQTHYRTAITAVYGSQYPIAGRLDLEFFPDGIVRGYYWPQFQKQYIPVTGGRDGNYLWFNIGPAIEPQDGLDLGTGPGGTYHVVGTVGDDGSFTGQVYPEFAPGASGMAMQSTFAAPQPTANEQYTFKAVPMPESSPTTDP